ERNRLEPARLDLASDHVEGWTRVSAGLAAIRPEVPDVRRVVRVGMPAAKAVLRVRGMLERRPGMRRVVDAEADDAGAVAPEVGDERVVRVQSERRCRVERGDGGAPPFGYGLELAVAVELVAEEVSQRDDAWPDAAHHLGQRGLVDLEERKIGARGR